MRFSLNPQLRSLAHLISIVLCLSCGFIFGCSLYEPSFLSLMRCATLSPMSIVGIFVCIYLPLICTYFSFNFNKPIVIDIICFIKAAGFGFSCCLIDKYFSSAGWLIRLLLLFSDSFTLFILLSLWIQHFLFRCNCSKNSLFLAFFFCTVLIFIDIFAVFPFIQGLF